MKNKFFNKKLLVTLSIVLIAVMALFIAGCSNNNQDEPISTEPVQTTEPKSSVIEKGEGENAFIFIAVDLDGNNTHYMIRTNKETVGEALIENGLISGDDGEYGLYVKTVNGITLDYDKDGKYWAFYEENTYANQGVDSTPIKEGGVYTFKPE